MSATLATGAQGVAYVDGLRQRSGSAKTNDTKTEEWGVPPTRPSQPFYEPLLDVWWRIWTKTSGSFAFSVMEPPEIFFMLVIYISMLFGVIMAIMQLPAYGQMALRRLHYYITGE